MAHDPYARPTAPPPPRRRRRLRLGRFFLVGLITAAAFVATAVYVFPDQLEQSALPPWAKPSGWSALLDKGKVAWDDALRQEGDPDAAASDADTAPPTVAEPAPPPPTKPVANGLLPTLQTSSTPAPPTGQHAKTNPSTDPALQDPANDEHPSDPLAEALEELKQDRPGDEADPDPSQPEPHAEERDPDTLTTFFGVKGKRPNRD